MKTNTHFLKAFVPIILIIPIILLTCAYTNTTKKLSDIDNHWSKAYVEYLINKGSVNGYPDGTFRPDDNVTYGEAIKLIVATFNDTIEYGSPHWATNYLQYAKQTGIVPSNMNLEDILDVKISRKEVIYMVYQSLIQYAHKPVLDNDRSEIDLPFKDVTVNINKYGIDYYNAIKESYYLGIVIGHDTGLMSPNDNITRAEMATIMSRAYGEEMRIYTSKTVTGFYPNNYSMYRMILAYMPNSFYEAGNDTFAKYVLGGTPYEYLDPLVRDGTDIALNTTRSKAEKALNAMLNVSYKMSEGEWSLWKNNIAVFNDVTQEQIEQYTKFVKDNRIIIKGGALINPCTLGVFQKNDNQTSVGIKGILNYYIQSNPTNQKHLTIAEYITNAQMISNIENPKYVVMYLEEGTDTNIFSLYNFKYNMKDIVFVGE